jgi:hypothetical protein
MDMSSQFHAPAALTLNKEPKVPIKWQAGWVGPGVRPDALEKRKISPAGNRPMIPRLSSPISSWHSMLSNITVHKASFKGRTVCNNRRTQEYAIRYGEELKFNIATTYHALSVY